MNFTDLIVWKEAHSLVIAVYDITEKFPKNEIFGLTSQIRRASVSITSNLAEGFGRRSLKEKINFYNISMGSVYEVENQLYIAKDINYINDDRLNLLLNRITQIKKLCYSLIRSVNDIKNLN